jgi:hypothetical protein
MVVKQVLLPKGNAIIIALYFLSKSRDVNGVLTVRQPWITSFLWTSVRIDVTRKKDGTRDAGDRFWETIDIRRDYQERSNVLRAISHVELARQDVSRHDGVTIAMAWRSISQDGIST